MKIAPHNRGSCCRHAATRRGERGFLVIALLAIVAIMLIYVNVNVRLLGNLKRELKLVEQQQIQRLEKIGAQPSPLTKVPTNETTASLDPNSERRLRPGELIPCCNAPGHFPFANPALLLRRGLEMAYSYQHFTVESRAGI